MSVLYALVSTGLSGVSRTFLPGVPTGQRLGWLQFAYGSYAGKLHPLNFANSIVFPEAPGATGGYLICPPEINWSVIQASEPTGGWSVQTAAGAFDVALNLIAALGSAGAPAASDIPEGIGYYTELPYVNGSNQVAVVGTPAGQTVASFLNKVSEMSFYFSALAFASEIAQWTAMYSSSVDTQSLGPFTGANLVEPVAASPRYAQISVPSFPDQPGYYFGPNGALMLGHFCWEYDGYYGPLQYLNSQQIYTVPEDPSATSLYLVLKPGLTATVEMGTNPYDLQSIITATGEINFLAGKLAGMPTVPPG